MRNQTKTVLLSVLAACVIVIGYITYTVKTMPEFEIGKIIDNPPNEYLDVFSSDARKKLIPDYVLKPKHDSMMCKYIYDGKYPFNNIC